MKLLSDILKAKFKEVRTAIVDDDRRRTVIFVWFNLILSFVSGAMTVVNIFTGKRLLMVSTLAFFLACLLNVLISRQGEAGQRLGRYLFLAEGVVLCGFFCVSGTPEGFSALWTCFIPSFALALLGSRKGSIYSGVGFVMIFIFFWTPWGRSLLQYRYTDSFMLRFPMIYVAFYLMALFLETVRSVTQGQLVAAEQRYMYLYKHDALTGLYNRYGFNEKMDEIFTGPEEEELALYILDLDLFKNVNDTYGHAAGDAVLRFAADTIQQAAGEDAVVCRWGGEEFTMLTRGTPDPAGLAERIRQKFEAAVITAGEQEVRVTVSIGYSIFSGRNTTTIAEFVKSADRCLYQAKEAGRNRVAGIRL